MDIIVFEHCWVYLNFKIFLTKVKNEQPPVQENSGYKRLYDEL